MRQRNHIASVCLVALFLVGQAVPAQEGRGGGVRLLEANQRVALVIGNADYNSDIGRLKNPTNDATDVAAALSRLGFHLVGGKAHFNLNKRQMLELIREFSRQIQVGSVGVFYFGGHGVQVDKRNYLIPITDLLQYQEDAEFEAVDVDTILREMEFAENAVKVLILDACRNNNLPKRRRNTANGLAEPERKPEGILIAFATADGQTASDNAEWRNGLFTQQLLKHIETPNISLDRIFRTIRNDVKHLSQGKQRPFFYQSLSEDVFLKTTKVAARPTSTPTKDAIRQPVVRNHVPATVELEKFQAANGKYGYKDKKDGSVIIGPRYDMAFSFVGDLANVTLNGKEGYIDKRGKVVIPLKYDFVSVKFSQGLSKVRLGTKYGFIDQVGNEVIPIKYDDAGSYSEGLVWLKLGVKYGYVDRTGKVVIPFKYDGAESFAGGKAKVKRYGNWGLIDKTDRIVFPFKYEGMGSFTEGLLIVKLNGKWGVVDESDKLIVPLKYDYLRSFYNGLASVRLGRKYGYIDKTGKVTVPLIYDNVAFYFREGLAWVSLGNKFGYFDKTGKQITPIKYDAADSFSGGKAKVKLSGREFYIDKEGKEVAAP